MSESSPAQPGDADRPTGVTDPLLWKLAAAVADAHQPGEEGTCGNPSCVGASWPCAAWNNAQEGMRAAQAPPRTGSGPSATDDGAVPDRDDRSTDWSARLVPAA